MIRLAGLLFASTLLCACGNGDTQSGESDIEPIAPGGDVIEGKADSALGNVELKLVVEQADIARAFSKFGLQKDDASERDVYFYDTMSLDLYASGLILRARKVVNDPDDSTVKLRPLDSNDVDSAWFDHDGFKCEIDVSAQSSTSSCSLTWRQDSGEIEAVADGTRDIDQLFSSEQETFATDYADPPPDWTELEVLGPSYAWVWSFKSRKLNRKLTLEYWNIGPDIELLEISTRTTESAADDVKSDVEAYLAERDIDIDASGDTKTKAALEYFSGQ